MPDVTSFFEDFPWVLPVDRTSLGCSVLSLTRERSKCLCVRCKCEGFAVEEADTGGPAVAVGAMPLVPAPSCAPPLLSTELLAALPTLTLDFTPET